MKNRRKKWSSIVTVSLLVVMVFSSLTYAARTKKVLEAWYGTINIIYNGYDRTNEFQPFIVDGVTYVPLRTMSTIFNKTVDWNNDTFTATVTDKEDADVIQLNNRILLKDLEIAKLEEKIKNLEDDLSDKGRNTSLSDLEKDLNRRHDKFKKVDFDIELSGRNSNKNIEVKIKVDLDRDNSNWRNLSSSDKESYLEDIVDDILYDFPKADIKGYIWDTDSRKNLLDFEVRSNGKVSIDGKSSSNSSSSLRNLEKDLDSEYYDYFTDITLDIELKGDSYDVEFYVNLDYDYYYREWNKLSDSSIKRLMSNIYDDIEDEWDDADITGYIYDTYDKSDLAKYYRTSRGVEKFDNY